MCHPSILLVHPRSLKNLFTHIIVKLRGTFIRYLYITHGKTNSIFWTTLKTPCFMFY
eukprot:UN09916